MDDFRWTVVFIGYTFLWIIILSAVTHRLLKELNRLLDRLMARDFIEYKQETKPEVPAEEHNHIKKKLYPDGY